MAVKFIRAAILVGFAAGGSYSALAAVTPELATEMLARAQAADTKCNILKTADKDELSSIVAQAEIALAESTGVEVTKATTARGRELGSKVACDATTRQAVSEVFEAARGALGVTSLRKQDDVSPAESYDRDEDEQIATATVSQDLPTTRAKTTQTILKKPIIEKSIKTQETKKLKTNKTDRKVVVLATPKTLTRPEIKTPVQLKSKELTKSNSGAAKGGEAKSFVALSSYGKIAETYYVELRCHKLPLVKVQKMYGEVLTTHKQAVSVHGKPAVKSLLKKAEARAKRVNCG